MLSGRPRERGFHDAVAGLRSPCRGRVVFPYGLLCMKVMTYTLMSFMIFMSFMIHHAPAVLSTLIT